MTDDDYAVTDEQLDDSAAQGSSVRDRVEKDLAPLDKPEPTLADGDSLEGTAS